MRRIVTGPLAAGIALVVSGLVLIAVGQADSASEPAIPLGISYALPPPAPLTLLLMVTPLSVTGLVCLGLGIAGIAFAIGVGFGQKR
ncbi:hypothetical protein [Naasia aerilata]|uniref:Uncharacterized protein n=1 Tax=Naasia aerilata TaxID=1162966 RepID=A0ABM8GE88_9MICO|nr:hypothetical protein [Naasia aerilata]BDZ46626.1 hypothetical protein GCM10025866_25350 [Naasia aerilata]